MAILTPDKTSTIGGVTVKEYLLTKHNPNKIDMPTASMDGKVIGVTIHSTDWISVASGTTPAEQYTRATYNGNMKDVRVHYYVDDTCAWQNLPLTLSGWHAADGSGNGNRRTIAIECIMSSAYNSKDQKSEDNAARLAAALLKKYKLDINHLYTHTHWLNVKDGKSGNVDTLNTAKNSYKNCPAYILPHWAAFKAKVQAYMKSGTSTTTPTTTQLYRVRKSWNDAKSQIGAFASIDNAKNACKAGYSVFDSSGKVVYVPSQNWRIDWKQGEKVNIAENAQLFASETTSTPSSRLKGGVYYIYDGICCKNGRYRITTKAEYCGKTPVGKYVTGYVSLDKMR